MAIALKKELPTEQPVQEMTLPQLLSVITRRYLSAIQKGEAANTQHEQSQAQNDLKLWYQSQNKGDNKAEWIKKTKKDMESFQRIGDVMVQELGILILQDTV